MSLVRIETEDAVTTLTLSRPDKRNAMSDALLAEIAGSPLFARAALAEGAEVQAELEILRERLRRLEVPEADIKRALDDLARTSLL